MSSFEEEIRNLNEQIKGYNSRLLSATTEKERDTWAEQLKLAREEKLALIKASTQHAPQDSGKDRFPMMYDVLRKTDVLSLFYFAVLNFSSCLICVCLPG